MPFHNSRLIASALFAGLIVVPGAALAQSDEPATQETQSQQDSQTQQDTGTQEDTQAQQDTGTDEETQSQPAQSQAGTMEPTDEQLDSFAAATIDIVQIQEAAQQQMQAAVEEAGLTIEEYNQIAQAAQSNPEIDQALQQLIQDRIGG